MYNPIQYSIMYIKLLTFCYFYLVHFAQGFRCTVLYFLDSAQSNESRMGSSEVRSVKPQEDTPGKAEATLKIDGQKVTSQVSLL